MITSQYYSISQRILQGLHNNLGWEDLNQIQKDAIPIVKAGHNIILIASTAGGKTEAAFIPIIDEIYRNKDIIFPNFCRYSFLFFYIFPD